MRSLIPLLLLCTPAAAQEFSPRDTDTVLDRQRMQETVIGATHEFYDGGQSFFSISGTYTYTYADGLVAYGQWSWPENAEHGVICTSFTHGFQRCDMYVASGRGLVLLTSDGLRLPIKVNSADG